MKFLLFYKGSYGDVLRGPEMRYRSLANALLADGHQVTLVARSFSTASGVSIDANTVMLNQLVNLILSFARSDVIVLHGGGPVILALSLLLSFFNKRVILDSYVPHWIELDQIVSNGNASRVLIIKSIFNAFRSYMALLVFDAVMVANRRQQDLMRGMIAPLLQTTEFSRIHVVPFGCDNYISQSRETGIAMLNQLDPTIRLQNDDFLIGWLGGTYGWFDLNSVLKEAQPALLDNPKMKIIFFGVDERKKNELIITLDSGVVSQIIFLPWVNFSQRFSYWAAFDLSLVWGSPGYENDYASRTRNFDCLTLGLPIIQNFDDEWGQRLINHQAGLVTTLEKLSVDMMKISKNPEQLLLMREGMIKMASDYSWNKFSNKVVWIANQPRLTALRRVIGLFSMIISLPVFIVFSVYALLSRKN